MILSFKYRIQTAPVGLLKSSGNSSRYSGAAQQLIWIWSDFKTTTKRSSFPAANLTILSVNVQLEDVYS